MVDYNIFIDKIKKQYNEEYLIIAGDLCQIKENNGNMREIVYNILDGLLEVYKYVIWVPGNHEYYYMSLEEGDKAMREIVSRVNRVKGRGTLFLLNRDELNITVTRKSGKSVELYILGCTLWSENKLVHPEPRDKSISSEDRLARHILDKTWLESKLKERPGKYIVVTHYPPTNHFKNLELYSEYYVNNLDHLVVLSKFWCHGHIHYATSILVGNHIVYSNPFGYLREKRIQRPCYLYI